MDVSTLTSLIGSLGFPIVCCIVMFKQNSDMQKTLSQLSETLTSFNERLKNIEDSIDDVVNNEKDGGK